MYRKLAIKIRVLSVCILFLWGLINTFIGISIINISQALLGFLILIGGFVLPLVFFSLISYICDIIDQLYYALRNIKKSINKNCKETVCPCCKQTVSKDE